MVIRWQEDEKHRNSQTVVDGQKNFAFIWTVSLRSTSRTVRHGTTGTSTRAPSRWYAVMMIAKVDRCEHEEILSPLHEFSQVFDKNKDERILLFRRTREYGKDHSMKHCEQSWDGRVKFGTFIGRNFPLHPPHNNGGNTNTKILNAANIKTLNGEITVGGNSDDYRHLSKPYRIFFTEFRVQTPANDVHATGGEDRTLRCTHFAQWIGLEHREGVHERIQRKVRCLFWIEHRGRRKWRSSSTERPRKDVDLQRKHQESPMKEQTVRIVGTRRVKFLLQSIEIWEQLSEKGVAVAAIPDNEGRITQAWANVRGGRRAFSLYFWHSEGWTPRNEALLEAVSKRARVTRHLWEVVCDADTSPVGFE